MKQVINKKLYNTETAEKLHSYTFSNTGDFHYISESLYKTKYGNYFLAGTGGAASKYGKACGNNSMSGGTAITPMTVTEAIQWLEDHDGSEVIENHFASEIQEA